MTYLTFTNVIGGSADDYTAILAALPTTEPDGLLTRHAGSTDDGFAIVAVWSTKADWDRFAAEMLGPAVRAVRPGDGTASTVEFEATDQFVAAPLSSP